jgi:hypothetical protein
MTSIPYSTKPVPTINELRNVNVNPATLANGDVVSWDTTLNIWKNTAGGGGGGGATITGTDDSAVFKSGTNGVAPADGITKNTALNGYTASLDTANKRLAINHTAGAIAEQLEVNGNAVFKNGGDNLKIDGNELGVANGVNALTLYSANAVATADAIVKVDSVVKNITCSEFRSLNPTAFDVANSTDLDGLYKIKLQLGTTLWSITTPAFDPQEPFRPLSFPTGQIVEYANKVPLVKAICISRNLGPQIITPAGVRVVSSLGTRRNAPFFDDGMHYDPCNMRAKLTGGTGWNSFGAPVEFRVADLKVGWTITWNIHGTWTAPGPPLNRGDVYIVQYRNGAVVYNHLVQQLEQETESWWCGTKTFMGWDATAGEDFDVLTDYYELELANLAGVDLQYNSARLEAECWLAQ